MADKKRMAHLSIVRDEDLPAGIGSKPAVWGVLMAALAAAMMLGSGNGLSMLQTLSIVAAFPFAFIMVISMAALVKALRKENEE